MQNKRNLEFNITKMLSKVSTPCEHFSAFAFLQSQYKIESNFIQSYLTQRIKKNHLLRVIAPLFNLKKQR